MRERGHTLIELMVALTLSSLLMVGLVSLFAAQAGVVRHETERDQAAHEAQTALEILSRLLRQAEADSIAIRYEGAASAPNAANALEQASDAIRVDFTVPANYAVWPADGSNNAIRIRWNNSDAASAYAIRITNSASKGTLDDNGLQRLAGGNQGLSPRVINLDFWPLRSPSVLQANATDAPLAGYLLRVTVRAANQDPSYTNPLDGDGPLQHYRTYTASGIVAPRN